MMVALCATIITINLREERLWLSSAWITHLK
jgi:hypothetical protein